MSRLRRQLAVALCSALLLVALVLSGCAPLLSGVSGTTSPLQGSSVLAWPFDIHAGSWVIENGYNTGPDHHGYELDSFDLQRQDATTTGQSVLSPASGDVIDIGSAYPGDYTSGHCARVSIAGYAGYYVMVCHLVSVTASHVNRGDPIGTVAGGPNGNHIHITLYYLPPGTPDTTVYAADRAAIPFSAPWTIAGCAYSASGKSNEWGGTAVPCGATASVSTATPTRRIIQGVFHEYPLPTPDALPFAITSDPQGNIWFAEDKANKIGRMTPAGVFTEFVVGSPNCPGGDCLLGITYGVDGNIWFTEADHNKIGRMTPDGSITEFDVPTPDNYPGAITVGPDGNIWFTEERYGKIARITNSGAITEFTITSPGGRSVFTPVSLTVGPDGNLWFGDLQGAIGRVTLQGNITEWTTSEAYDRGITSGSDGALWFTESSKDDSDTGRIGRISVDGTIQEFSIPSPSAEPAGIVKGSDGNMWFAEVSANKIGRITPSGEITEYPVPTGNPGVDNSSEPYGLVIATDGSLWFTEAQANKIGHLT